MRNLPPINPSSKLCLPWFILNTAFIAQFRFVLYIQYHRVPAPLLLSPGNESALLLLCCHSPPGRRKMFLFSVGTHHSVSVGFPHFFSFSRGDRSDLRTSAFQSSSHFMSLELKKKNQLAKETEIKNQRENRK